MFEVYDVIVVGGGHAGCEAAHAAAILGANVLLITMDLQRLGAMSCNPAMGGIAKGQIVREIDALGGMSGIVSDESMIQFRMLNKSKGPGMWSPRSQNDRQLFSAVWKRLLEQNVNISFWQDTVVDLDVSRGTVSGVRTTLGHSIKAKSVILTNGTFLNGTIHIGRKQFGGGRIGEKAALGLTESLKVLGFKSDRMKTGTPPRVDGRTLDYSKMEVQKGDRDIVGFSYLPNNKIKPNEQLCCWITHTNEEVHEILKEGFGDSPMLTGNITGTGPRYCPSVEDKVSRFADKASHQLFVEPEGWNTVEIYVNGFSTSLPENIQYRALQLVPGFKNCKMFRPGYAIEYDYFPPTQLKPSLETALVSGLFFAGQINGTTGYEEAACQGLIAGINAFSSVKNKEPLILARDQAYIGVLIDDLVSKGTDEPYRMFTSRAEFRTLLRQDNADLRLTYIGHQLGLASYERMALVNTKNRQLKSILKKVTDTRVNPEDVNTFLSNQGSTPIIEKTSLQKLLLRPNIALQSLVNSSNGLAEAFEEFDFVNLQQAEIQVKYSSYIDKEKILAERLLQMDQVKIPASFSYESIGALGTEAKTKLSSARPCTIGQASRISGINPTDIQILLVYMGR